MLYSYTNTATVGVKGLKITDITASKGKVDDQGGCQGSRELNPFNPKPFLNPN